MNETLTCEAGHTWTRVRTRGRKPRWCPEHLPVKPIPAVREKPAQEPVEAFEPETVDEPTVPVLKHSVKDEVDPLLINPGVGEETKRKLRYCYNKFEAGRGDGYLFQTYKNVIREAQRNQRSSVSAMFASTSTRFESE